MTADKSGSEQTGIDITVAVTCFNEASYITDTIENIVGALAVTGHSYEIIVVDDASQDDSVRMIEDYIKARPDHPVRLIKNELNRGRAWNFVKIASLGKGRYYRQCCGDN